MSPVYPHQRARYFPKEPYRSAKQPYTFAKEPHASAKEPYISANESIYEAEAIYNAYSRMTPANARPVKYGIYTLS